MCERSGKQIHANKITNDNHSTHCLEAMVLHVSIILATANETISAPKHLHDQQSCLMYLLIQQIPLTGSMYIHHVHSKFMETPPERKLKPEETNTRFWKPLPASVYFMKRCPSHAFIGPHVMTTSEPLCNWSLAHVNPLQRLLDFNPI